MLLQVYRKVGVAGAAKWVGSQVVSTQTKTITKHDPHKLGLLHNSKVQEEPSIHKVNANHKGPENLINSRHYMWELMTPRRNDHACPPRSQGQCSLECHRSSSSLTSWGFTLEPNHA
eukprot:5938508-Amphidinium_carterae.1